MKLFYNSITRFIVDIIPGLKNIRRYYLAWLDSMKSTRRTYSQFGEDAIVMDLFPSIIKSDSIYIEVGANQPTQISNTYLFYRKGFRGIVIEPNRFMTSLFRRFRPEDIHLEIGCADESGVGKFKTAATTVTCGFSDDIKAVKGQFSWIPLLTVDEVWRDAGKRQNVFLLSIDTEGHDLKVLKGAKETLEHTASVIIETRDEDLNDIKDILLGFGFELVRKTDCNLIWINKETTRVMNCK